MSILSFDPQIQPSSTKNCPPRKNVFFARHHFRSFDDGSYTGDELPLAPLDAEPFAHNLLKFQPDLLPELSQSRRLSYGLSYGLTQGLTQGVNLLQESQPDPTPSLKRKRSGPHIVPKLALNAMAQDVPIQDPSLLVPSMSAWVTPASVLPLSVKIEQVRPTQQRAYGCSEPHANQFEQLLFDLNRFMPMSAALRVGPYTVPLNVVRFVVDKTGRFLALVACPWSPAHHVFCLFHFFKNLLHLLHQMDKDDRLERLRKFGESQVLYSTFSNCWQI